MQKKQLTTLVTSFLVLALLAGSVSLAITSLDRPQTASTDETEQTNSPVPEIGESALVESLPTGPSIEGYNLAVEFSPKVAPKENYTDLFAKTLAYELVSNNPAGPSDISGIVPPGDFNAIVEEYVDEAALTPTTYAVDKTRLNIVESYTADDVTNYLAEVDQIFASAESQYGIGGLVKRYGASPDPETGAVEASNFIFSEAQDRLYKTKTPAPFLTMHKSVLRYLELNKQLSDVDYNSDPLKASVFIAKFPSLRNQEVAAITKATEELETSLPEVFANTYEPFPIASLFGIKKANAQFSVFDWKNFIKNIQNGIAQHGSWQQALMAWGRQVATQVLKNQIVKKMIQQTIRWVQGGGKPQFITNWKKFLQDGVNKEVGRVIQEIEPRLCQNFRSFTRNHIQQSLGIGYYNEPIDQITCSLDQIVSNVNSFYADFRNGSWGALGGTLLPQNNVWGSLLVSNELIYQQATAQAQAQTLDAQTNQGFLGTKRCVNYEVVEGISRSVIQAYPDFSGLAPKGCYKVIDFREASGEREVCDIKVCRKDGYQTTTPGGQVAGQVEKALGASLDNIVNAQDLAGLAGVLVDAAITRLTKIGSDGILGLFGGGGDDSDTGDGTEPTTPQEQADLDAQRNQGLILIDGYINRMNQAESLLDEWSALRTTVRPLLDSVALTCPARASEAQARIATMDRIATAIASDKQQIAQLEGSLNTVKQQITSASSILAVSNLITSLNQYNSQIATYSTRAANRSVQLQNLRVSAEANLENQSCNTPLAPLNE